LTVVVVAATAAKMKMKKILWKREKVPFLAWALGVWDLELAVQEKPRLSLSNLIPLMMMESHQRLSLY
jgi:hypothetical protein